MDQEKVISKQLKLGIQRRQGSVSSGIEKSGRYNTANSNKLKQIQKQNNKYKRTINFINKKRAYYDDKEIYGAQ